MLSNLTQTYFILHSVSRLNVLLDWTLRHNEPAKKTLIQDHKPDVDLSMSTEWSTNLIFLVVVLQWWHLHLKLNLVQVCGP